MYKVIHIDVERDSDGFRREEAKKVVIYSTLSEALQSVPVEYQSIVIDSDNEWWSFRLDLSNEYVTVAKYIEIRIYGLGTDAMEY